MPRAIQVLDKGHVALIRTMPSLSESVELTLDQAIVQAARASTTHVDLSVDQEYLPPGEFLLPLDMGLKGDTADRKLLGYLWTHGHHSPFEMAELQWHVKAPLFVRSQWMRHRTWSYNEMSGRYQEVPEEYYTPETWRTQAQGNKQGSVPIDGYAKLAVHGSLNGIYHGAVGTALEAYRTLLNIGVSREMARMVLPQSMYTEFYAKVDLRNCLHFLSLRDHEGAQWEMQQYARAMKQLLRRVAPWTMALAFPEE